MYNCVLTFTLLLPCFLLAADEPPQKEDGETIPTVQLNGPRWFGARYISELDKWFADLKQGQRAKVELSFPRNVGPLWCRTARVAAGSITFHTVDGCVTFSAGDSKSAIVTPSSSHKSKEIRAVREFDLGVRRCFEDPRDGSDKDPVAFLVLEVDDGAYWENPYYALPLPMSKRDDEFVVTVEVEFSEDFKGEVGPWFIPPNK